MDLHIYMELPLELWKLIINFPIYDLKPYKSCILVNKTFYRIISEILNGLPDIEIAISYKGDSNFYCDSCPMSPCKHNLYDCNDCEKKKWIAEDEYPAFRSYPRIFTSQNTVKIKKHFLLLSKTHICYTKGSHVSSFPLLINEIINKENKQMCYHISIMRNLRPLVGSYVIKYCKN